MMAQDDILSLVGDIYDCALDPERWPATLEAITRLLAGSSAVVALHAMRKPGFEIRARWNVEPDYEADMRANLPINPFVPLIWYLAEEDAFSTLTLMTEPDLQATQFYRNALRPHGVRDSAIGVLAKSTSHFGAISIQRSIGQMPFSDLDITLLARLTPHLRRSMMISELLDARALERDRLSSALDLLAVGIVLAQGDGRIVHANREAQRMFEGAGPLRLANGRLTSRDPLANRELEAAVAGAASGSSLDLPRNGHAVAVRSEEGRELDMWVLPLDGGLRRDIGGDFSASVAIFIREHGASAPVPAELFVRRYGITPAECRVLVLIVQGMTTSEAADSLGVSLVTVKSHLKSLFIKTGTDGQTDLVRLAMSALAPASM